MLVLMLHWPITVMVTELARRQQYAGDSPRLFQKGSNLTRAPRSPDCSFDVTPKDGSTTGLLGAVT